ncbi:hypothetical protein U9M48_011489 [Paspalum notatum var. saurae]|uniref:Rx N-terminal domain-containing protein n=1 Tax=Paspalum notatum var. saurae TaxID=547442 RepID=A0AAQ3SVV4_PASNO
MEILMTVIMGEIANRSISFLIDKCSSAPKNQDERLHDLQRLLLRVNVIVEEAEGRDITNKAMLYQLNMLRKEMYRGYFIMDNFRSQANNEEKNSEDGNVSHHFTPSKLNPAKRLFFSTSDNAHGKRELQQSLYNLNNVIVDVSEFKAFLRNYPPLYRQPYSMHLFLDKSMFGRQMEMERILNFLMLPEPSAPPITKRVAVLPIVGVANTGKSTLVAHVCNNERVRNHFGKIVFITENDLKDRGLINLKDRDVVLQPNSPLNGNGQVLAIIEFSEDIDEAAWRSCLACATCLGSVVKIIITSRSEKITRFGTTEALVLNLLPLEAYWYFFKVLTFGSADPKDQPRLESVALDICKSISGSFLNAHIFSSVLRADLSTTHWCMVQATLRGIMTRNACLSYECCVNRKNPVYVRGRVTNDLFAIYPSTEISSDETVPETTLPELLLGGVRCEGKFEVLALKSRIAPYKNYTNTCEMLTPRSTKAKRHQKPR